MEFLHIFVMDQLFYSYLIQVTFYDSFTGRQPSSSLDGDGMVIESSSVDGGDDPPDWKAGIEVFCGVSDLFGRKNLERLAFGSFPMIKGDLLLQQNRSVP